MNLEYIMKTNIPPNIELDGYGHKKSKFVLKNNKQFDMSSNRDCINDCVDDCAEDCFEDCIGNDCRDCFDDCWDCKDCNFDCTDDCAEDCFKDCMDDCGDCRDSWDCEYDADCNSYGYPEDYWEWACGDD